MVLNLLRKDVYAIVRMVDLFCNKPLQIYPCFDYQVYDSEIRISKWICSII
jgi:hypothetical protein